MTKKSDMDVSKLYSAKSNILPVLSNQKTVYHFYDGIINRKFVDHQYCVDIQLERRNIKSCPPKHSTLLTHPLVRAHVYPIASCSSKEMGEHEEALENEQTELRLPGFQRKSTSAPHTKFVGEYKINQFLETETGWDRVKYMYRIKSGQFEDEYTRALNTMFYRTVVMGFFMNAMVAGVKYDKVNKNLSKTEAVRAGVVSQALLPKKVFKSALKDTLKLSALSFSLLHMAHTIGAYRNKTSVWEFAFSSAIGFGAIGATQGIYKFGKFTIGGAIIGSIGGYLACAALQSSGYTQELRTLKRMKQKVKEQTNQENGRNELMQE